VDARDGLDAATEEKDLCFRWESFPGLHRAKRIVRASVGLYKAAPSGI
jgi:hypothetical protein